MLQPDNKIMERAIQLARDHYKQSGHAVAAIIVKGDDIIAEATTTITKQQDPTCHAEINAIRAAVHKLHSKVLFGCYLYTTYEPCPMCTSAAIWAKMSGIVYGASREDRTEHYSWRVMIPAKEVIDRGEPKLELYPEFMRDDCKPLLLLK